MNRRFFLCAGGAGLAGMMLPNFTMADSRTIQLVYFHNYPPFSWDQGEGMRGILVDLLDEVLERRMGIQTSHTGYPWKRAQLQVKLGIADAFCTVPTSERAAYTEISNEPVLSATFNPFIPRGSNRRAELERVKSLDDLHDFRVGIYLGSGWAKKNLKDRGLDLFETSSLDSCLAMLAAGRVDVVIDTSQVLRYRIRELELQSAIEELPAVLDEAPFKLCIGKQSPFANILPVFDEKNREIRTDGTYDKILGVYG